MAPWDSVLQSRWGHSPAGKKALGPAKVKEFDNATPKGSLAGTKGSAQRKRQGKPSNDDSHAYDWRKHSSRK